MNKRVGFTIVLNGLHHLTHNDYARRLATALDHWVVVDGLAEPHGSTSWCKNVSSVWHNNGASVDGTLEYLFSLKATFSDTMTVITPSGPWHSKDSMVNAALDSLAERLEKTATYPVWLWEVDADEQWEATTMADAETALQQAGGDTGMFLCDYYVGQNIRAVGEWGEGNLLPYRRLWKWNGQRFNTHEPPTLVGGNGKEVLLQQRFDHYSYYYDKDVRFKEEYYGDAGLYQRWRNLQNINDFPRPVSDLITGTWAATNTQLVRY